MSHDLAQAQRLIDRFKGFYRNLAASDISGLDSLYTDTVVFKDPVHEIRGLITVQDYMASLCEDLEECQFEYLDELVSDNSAYIKWIMHFRHPKLGKRMISVRGTTHIHYDSKINFHEDIYDMGAMLYEHLPLLGSTTRWLKRRLQA